MEREKTRRCIFCMEGLEPGSERCPRCKKAPWDYRPAEGSLPPETELHGRYRLGVVLGVGGFGRTYMGWDMALDKAVAVKEYAPKGLCLRNTEGKIQPTEVESFQQGKGEFWGEAQTVYARFDVPGICPVLECFEEKGTAYIVEEYMPGGTLRELLDKRPGHHLVYEEALRLFAPVLEGLAKLHSEGMLHLDISPDNLMLDAEGTLRLIDFGSARGKKQERRPTAKQAYAPPEQLGAGGCVGPWSDIYALCAVLYEAVGGERPVGALPRMRRDTLSPLSRWAQLPVEGEAAIMQGLGLDIQSRFFALSPLMERLGLASLQKDLLEAHRRQWGDRWLEAVSAPAVLKKRSRRGLTGLQKRRIAMGIGTVVLVLGLLVGGFALYESSHPQEVLQWRLERAYAKGKPERQVLVEGTELYDQVLASLEGVDKTDYGSYDVTEEWAKKMGLASNSSAYFPLKESLGKKVLEVTLGVKLREENRSSFFYGSVYAYETPCPYLYISTGYSVTETIDTGYIDWHYDAVTGYMSTLRLSTTDRELATAFLTDTFRCFVPETYFTVEEAEEILTRLQQTGESMSISHHSRFYLYGWYREESGWYLSLQSVDSMQTLYGY